MYIVRKVPGEDCVNCILRADYVSSPVSMDLQFMSLISRSSALLSSQLSNIVILGVLKGSPRLRYKSNKLL